MAIYRLLQNSAFAPEDITPLVAAYDDCLRTLKLSDRSDPIAEIIAKKIIEIAQTGIRDSARLGRLALAEIGFRARVNVAQCADFNARTSTPDMARHP